MATGNETRAVRQSRTNEETIMTQNTTVPAQERNLTFDITLNSLTMNANSYNVGISCRNSRIHVLNKSCIKSFFQVHNPF